MSDTDVAAVAADDDFDVADDLLAAFDAAEKADTPEPPLETEEQAAERARDDKGRFAKVDDVKPDAQVDPVKPEPVAAKPAAQAAPVAPVVDPLVPAEPVKPPPGFSPTAKVVWDKDALSKEEWEAVKKDISKRNDEVGKGFEKLAEYKPIERFMEMAKAGGTTLDRALENYVGIERELDRDVISGIARICQNKGVHPVALAQAILARNGVAPSEAQAGDTQAARQQAPSVDLSPVMQKISALENFINQQQSQGVQSEIQRFASDPKHTFFENVKTQMGRLIDSGQAENLEDAYDQACWANKEIRDLLIKQQTAVLDPSAKANAATQARAAAKSITGSPIPNASAKGPQTSLEDEIRQLMDASV